ncbi:putative transporter component [Cognatishimia activa]|uniref:Putative transporter component n=1 Tax=Cognatishimia activa TaxID=1715691 RepID=A0A0P1IVE6_9RHOB|nr:YeeE/YedE thiosulfate transporter family protein [Cognatishimia activa]MEE2946072.1 YeeE/YedE thiosulfate transporter family protein [Pseudomonadota bacterium]CUK27529.1 putative transporter component [Cognatishimia activa]
METMFTPVTSLGGGLLLGLSAVLLMLGLGRIMGASGIFWGVIFPTSQKEFSWRAAMVLGMAISPLVIFVATGAMPDVDVPISPLMVAIGGVIVGFGASLGSGCTSGHGICGLPRLSVRSLVAVPTFMATAAITVFLIRHVFGIGG